MYCTKYTATIMWFEDRYTIVWLITKGTNEIYLISGDSKHCLGQRSVKKRNNNKLRNVLQPICMYSIFKLLLLRRIPLRKPIW